MKLSERLYRVALRVYPACYRRPGKTRSWPRSARGRGARSSQSRRARGARSRRSGRAEPRRPGGRREMVLERSRLAGRPAHLRERCRGSRRPLGCLVASERPRSLVAGVCRARGRARCCSRRAYAGRGHGAQPGKPCDGGPRCGDNGAERRRHAAPAHPGALPLLRHPCSDELPAADLGPGTSRPVGVRSLESDRASPFAIVLALACLGTMLSLQTGLDARARVLRAGLTLAVATGLAGLPSRIQTTGSHSCSCPRWRSRL